MSKERTSVSEEGLGSLTSCLMEGNADEEKGARTARRRALIVSIVVQILVLATLVMYPLLSHGERLAATVFTPVPPYSYSGGPTRPTGDNTPPGEDSNNGVQVLRAFQYPDDNRARCSRKPDERPTLGPVYSRCAVRTVYSGRPDRQRARQRS